MRTLQLFAFVSAILLSVNAFAETQTSTSNAWNSLENFSVSATSIYHGSTVKDPFSGSTVDRNGNFSAQNASYLDNEARAAYKITKTLSVGPVVPFLFFSRPDRAGNNFILGDVGVKFSSARTIATDNFVVNTNLILQAPTSDSSKARNMDYAIKTTPNARYTFEDARFSVGTLTEGKWYANVTKDKVFKLWAMPYANYKMTKSFSWNVAYEMEWHRDVNKAALDFASYQKDIQPGFIWEITKNVSVNPYLQFFTNKSISLKNAGIGTFISATVI